MEDCPGLQMALKVAGWGWKVAPGFCSKAGEKVPLMGDWVNNATTDEVVLREAWANRSWMWPGVVSGVDSCVVLDCDRPSSIDFLRKCVGSEGWVSGGLVYKTPGRGGGLHCVWSWPDFLGRDFRQAKVFLDDGGEVQIRGNGHWTLLCGAKRPDGVYEVLETPSKEGPIKAPEGLLRAILRESVVSTGKAVSADLQEISPEEAWQMAPWTDGRKNAVAGVAWYLAIRGTPHDEVVDICVQFGSECCLPVLSSETCIKKAEYAVVRAERMRAKQQAEMERSIGRWAKGRVWQST